MKLLIKSGRIIDPVLKFDQVGDILIEDGKIVEVANQIADNTAEIFDVQGLVVTPGLIDMHVHLREPGLEAKEDVATGTKAAAAGGFTTIACMPNTKPVVDSAILVSGLIERSRQEGLVNIKVIGAVSKGQQGKELAEIGDMTSVGAVAFSDDGHFIENAKLMRNALEYTGMFNKPIISHAEDETLSGDGYMHEGAVSTQLGMRGRPAVAEDIAVARDILLAEYTGAALHIAHVSSKGAVELIRQAKRRGVKVTAEVTPHHLTLTDDAVRNFDTATKVNPPLRSHDHVQAMIEGLKDGTIDVIASDHAPHAFEEKDREYKYAPAGFAGLETSLGVILTNLYHTGKFTLTEIVRFMASNPAALLATGSGVLKAGAPADITIIDPDLEWVVDNKKFYTRGKHTPYNGKQLKGKAVATIVNGKLVMKKGEVFE